jgi:hypothetical protein
MNKRQKAIEGLKELVVEYEELEKKVHKMCNDAIREIEERKKPPINRPIFKAEADRQLAIPGPTCFGRRMSFTDYKRSDG